MWSKEILINEMTKKVNEISKFYNHRLWSNSSDDPEFVNWFESTNRILNRLNNKDYLLSLVDFIPSGISSDTSNSEYDQAFIKWLKKAELKLNSIISEINILWVENQSTNKRSSQIVINNNNSQNIKINLEVILKNKLTGEQYSEFEKIRNEWDKDKLLNFFKELWTGVLSWIITNLIM